MKFHKKVLKNGLRVITAPMQDNPTVTVLVLVEAGSKYEEKKVNPKANDEINLEMVKHFAFLFVPYHIPLKNRVDVITKKKFFALSWPYWGCKWGLSFSQLSLNASLSVKDEYKPKYDNANEFYEWYKKNIFPEIPKS